MKNPYIISGIVTSICLSGMLNPLVGQISDGSGMLSTETRIENIKTAINKHELDVGYKFGILVGARGSSLRDIGLTNFKDNTSAVLAFSYSRDKCKLEAREEIYLSESVKLAKQLVEDVCMEEHTSLSDRTLGAVEAALSALKVIPQAPLPAAGAVAWASTEITTLDPPSKSNIQTFITGFDDEVSFWKTKGRALTYEGVGDAGDISIMLSLANDIIGETNKWSREADGANFKIFKAAKGSNTISMKSQSCAQIGLQACRAITTDYTRNALLSRDILAPLAEFVIIGENGSLVRPFVERFTPSLYSKSKYEYALTTLKTSGGGIQFPIADLVDGSVTISGFSYEITNQTYTWLKFKGTAASISADASGGLGAAVASPITVDVLTNPIPEDKSRNTDGFIGSLIPAYRLGLSPWISTSLSLDLTHAEILENDNYVPLGNMTMFQPQSSNYMLWDCTGTNKMVGLTGELVNYGINVSGSIGAFVFSPSPSTFTSAQIINSLKISNTKTSQLSSVAIFLGDPLPQIVNLSTIEGFGDLVSFLTGDLRREPFDYNHISVDATVIYRGSWTASSKPEDIEDASQLSAVNQETYRRYQAAVSLAEQLANAFPKAVTPGSPQDVRMQVSATRRVSNAEFSRYTDKFGGQSYNPSVAAIMPIELVRD